MHHPPVEEADVLARMIDSLVPVRLRDGGDEQRRARVLVVCIVTLLVACAFFLQQNLRLDSDRTPQITGLGVGGLLMLANLALLHRGVPPATIAAAVCLETLGAVTFLARSGNGIRDGSLRWLLIVPLLAGILVGTRFLALMAAAVIAAFLWLYLAKPLDTPVPPLEQTLYFEVLSNVGATLAITACAGVFEATRRRATEELQRALDAVRTQRAEVDALRAESELAREAAEAELLLKGEFVQLMMRQAKEQSLALEDTRKAMAAMTGETRNIGESVNAFAGAARDSNAAAERVDQLNDETEASIEEMTAALEQNAASIEEMRMTLREVNKHVDGLLENVESTSSAMTELDSSVSEVQRSADDAARLASDVIRDAQRGTEVVEHSRAGIETISDSAREASQLISVLGERVSEINAVLDVIENVSERTNLLALNAAIIAAQAGDAGRGFAVVADQIKALAEQTGGSTKQIEKIVAGVQSQTRSVIAAISNSERAIEEGARLSAAAESALQQIVRSAEQSSLVIKSIADATREQSGSISRVAKDTERVSQTVGSVATTVREQVRTSEQISQATERLSELGPKVQGASSEQVKGFLRVKETVAKLEAMIQTLTRAQAEQTRQSERVLAAVESVNHTQMQQVAHVEKLQRGASRK